MPRQLVVKTQKPRVSPVCVCVCARACVRARARKCACVRARACVSVCVCVCLCVCLCVCVATFGDLDRLAERQRPVEGLRLAVRHRRQLHPLHRPALAIERAIDRARARDCAHLCVCARVCVSLGLCLCFVFVRA